jgi:hypothetical protein
LASDLTTNEAVREPAPVGANVAFTVHVPPPATTAALQVSGSTLNSVDWLPVRVTDVMVCGALPVLVTVNVVAADAPCMGTEPKFLVDGLMERAGGFTPVPVSDADAVAEFELVAVSVPDLAPPSLGAK